MISFTIYCIKLGSEIPVIENVAAFRKVKSASSAFRILYDEIPKKLLTDISELIFSFPGPIITNDIIPVVKNNKKAVIDDRRKDMSINILMIVYAPKKIESRKILRRQNFPVEKIKRVYFKRYIDHPP